MKILSKQQFLKSKKVFMEKIKKGSIFIYPTDTIYGIGCNALNSKAVKKIRSIKKRKTAPFSVAVPSKKWILRNCSVKDKTWLEKLPGKYTLILKLKNKKVVSKEVNKNKAGLGVRIPKHWFSKAVSELNIPIVSTSVNVHGEKPMSSLEDLSRKIADKVDFIIYEGKKKSRASTIIDITKEKELIKRR